MSFPCELTLRKLPEGVRLCRLPIDEIKNLRVGQQVWRNRTVRRGENLLAPIQGDLFDIRAEIELAGASGFSLTARGQAVRYSTQDERFECDGVKAPWKPSDNRIRLQMLIDRSSLEVFIDQGQVSISKAVFPDPADMSFSLLADGGEIRVVSLEVNRLESIWLEAETRLGRPRSEVFAQSNTRD
jgi:levanase/fructan beta-fructosidase